MKEEKLKGYSCTTSTTSVSLVLCFLLFGCLFVVCVGWCVCFCLFFVLLSNRTNSVCECTQLWVYAKRWRALYVSIQSYNGANRRRMKPNVN
eukprot:m.88638 g.88638  ORF g.88638 m.88638 type:complete len:92 (+) comp12271_c0_seq6:1951-2226(+)